MFRALAGIGLLLASSAGLRAQTDSRPSATIDRLVEGFRNPPPQARLRCYWWWLNGNTTSATITHDLEQMKDKGFGGVLLVDANGADQNGNAAVPAGPRFGSPAWTALYLHALREADRLGLEVTLNITSGWNLGGPMVTPEDAAKLVTFRRLDVDGGRALDVTIEQPPTLNLYREIAVLAYPLHHGTALAPGFASAATESAARSAISGLYPPGMAIRAAATEGGFNMNNTASLLEDGEHAGRADVDAGLEEVRRLPLAPDGHLHLDLPAGKWEILRVGYTDSGAQVSTSSETWKGLAIDYMDRHAFDHYWDAVVEPLLTAAKPYTSLKYLASDSWELGGTNWTAGFEQQFAARRGYDPVPYLPVLAGRMIGSRDGSVRFLTDLRRTVADLIVVNHYDRFAERAAAFGMGVEAESGGPHAAPLDALETFRRQAVPQTEFWAQNAHRRRDEQRFFSKESASAADIYGKPYAASEGETSIGPQWSESLANDLKPAFDMAVTEGMNRLVWHEFTSSPADAGLPGPEYFAGTHLNSKVTWWEQSPAFLTYLNRVQFAMQQGTAVNDVLYFYGSSVPNFVRLKQDDPAHALPGYDYDVTDEDALLGATRINGPALVGPRGIRWRVLVLPATGRISLPVLAFVERYLAQGGTVVALPPVSEDGNVSADRRAEFRRIVLRLWGGCSGGVRQVGAGRIDCTANTHEALLRMGLTPDVTLLSGAALGAASRGNINYIHRRVAGDGADFDIYFLRSGYATPSHIDVRLRATGAAQLWDAVSGERHAVTPTAESAETTTLHLDLPAYGSTIVVFAPRSLPRTATAPSLPHMLPFTTAAGWSVTFQKDRGAPDRPFTVSALTDWTTWDPALVGFSGSATYRARFTAPPLSAGEQACLEFQDVREIARVTLNQQPPVTVWAHPFLACFAQPPQPGTNTLTVEVTNLWNNRLVADARLPEAERITRTNIRVSPDARPLSSGLMGPVQWVLRK